MSMSTFITALVIMILASLALRTIVAGYAADHREKREKELLQTIKDLKDGLTKPTE